MTYFLGMTAINLHANETPNIIIIVADDLGYAEVDELPQRKLHTQFTEKCLTPHIDSLAKTGIRCTAAYVTAPNCSPSRAGLLTGRYQTRYGYEFNPIGKTNTQAGVGIPLTEKLLPEYLKCRGYRTGCIGKWHLGGAPEFHPLKRGFDEFYGFLHEGHYYQPKPYLNLTTFLRSKSLKPNEISLLNGIHYSNHTSTSEPSYDEDNPLLRGNSPVNEASYLTQAITREAVDFIKRHASQPHFLYVAYNAVHSPMQGRTDVLNHFDDIKSIHRKVFLSVLHDLDQRVGVILNQVKSTSAKRETMLIFLSDNGGATRELTSSNLPYRGEKGQFYEGGIRVPCIMSYPGKLPQHKTFTPAISTLDVLPTLLSITGIPVPAQCDGVNLIPYLTGEQSTLPHHQLYWRQGSRAAFRQGSLKIVTNNQQHKTKSLELYDLEHDPYETNNLAASHPQQLKELQNLWETMNNEMQEPLFK